MGEERTHYTIEEAAALLKKHAKKLPAEEIDLAACDSRVVAEDIPAPISQPPFPRSAMDGYAIRKGDFETLCDENPASAGAVLPVAGEIDAGDCGVHVCEAGTAWRIMTGARIPEGADWVVKQENTDYGEVRVRISDIGSAPNISPVGEDFHQGDVLVSEGEVLNAYRIASLAAAGITRVRVRKKPAAAILNTGDELQGVGNRIGRGQIYDSNGAFLTARLQELGCSVSVRRNLPDDIEMTAAAIQEAAAVSDIVITTGGVSVGKRDYLEKAVQMLGAKIIFHGIEIKPGSPTMASVVDGVPVLSLSGNPYAASCVFEYLFPYGRQLSVLAHLENGYQKKRPLMRVVRGFLSEGSVRIDTKSRNASTRTPMPVNCLVELPAGEQPVAAGTAVRVWLVR